MIFLRLDESEIVFWTIPNIICIARIIGSFGLIGLAIAQLPFWFVGLYLVLAASDLIDGTIARRLRQSSELGAGLDSLADIFLSSSLLLGVSLLQWTVIRGELAFIVAAIVSYLMAIVVGFLKFRRLPTFHTYAAKLTHFLVAVAGVCLILGWSVWPFRIAAISTVLTNLESIAISSRLKHWRSDVPSVFMVQRTAQLDKHKYKMNKLDAK